MAYGDESYFSQNTLDAQGRPIYGTAGRQGTYHPTDDSAAWWEQNYIPRNGVNYTQALAGEMSRHPNNLGYLDQWGGGAVYDPTYGYILPYSTAETSGDWANAQAKPGIMGNLITAMVLGGAGAFGATAAGFGAGAAAGGAEGAGSVTFDGLSPALVDSGAGFTTPLAEAGADAAVGAGGGGTGASTTGSTFNWSDPSTWSNPFSSVPPGTTTAAQGAFGGDGAGGLGPNEEGITGGIEMPGASGGTTGGSSFDWSKFFSGSGSGWLNLLGSGVGALSSWLASNAQVKSAEEANAMLWAMYQQNRADAGPYREAGYGALENMVNLTTPGKQFDQMQLDPGYQFRKDEGRGAIDSYLASRGMFNSGRAGKELTRYGQNFASNEFGNVYNRNASLAGLGQTAVTNTGNQGATVAGQIGNNMTGAGNATASGYVGMGNAFTSGLQNYSNNQNQTALIEALLAGRTY